MIVKMKIRIIIVGKTKEKYIEQGIKEFDKRLQKYIPVEWIVVKEEKIQKNDSEMKIKSIEFSRILEKISSDHYSIILDSNAEQVTSQQFASFMLQKMNEGVRTINFIIGGALGLDPNIDKYANLKLSLSKLTFTHEMTRLILIEQIYRAFTIVKGEKYHK